MRPPATVLEPMEARPPGGLPIILAVLVSPPTDARGFRRYPMSLEVGVRLDTEHAPHRRGLAGCDGVVGTLPLNYRSVFASDLSLTGLYLVTALPYRAGVRLEVRVPLPDQVLHLPAVVRRLDTPARTAQGSLETAFGCGVDFQFQETASRTRRALMEFLVGNTDLGK